MDEDNIIENGGDKNPSSFLDDSMHGGAQPVPEALKNRSTRLRRQSNLHKPKVGKSPAGLPGINNSTSDDDGSPDNKFKRKNNLLSFLRNKRNKSKKVDKNDSDDDNGKSSQSDEQPTEIIAKTKKTILMVKISIIVGILALIAAVVVVIISFFASIFGISMNFSGLGSTTNLDPSLPYYNEAKKYHENLNKAVTDYSNSCGVFLNKSYIHATLTYLWEISDLNYNEKKMYNLMADNVDDVSKLMVTNCVVDYEVGGTFYNKLLTSSFLRRYYSTPLQYMEAETIVKEIFEYTEMGINLAKLTSGFISDNLKVTMGTCEQPYNKKLLNEGTGYSSTVNFSDYISGVIFGEVGGAVIKEEYKEFLKAFTIASSSFALGRSNYESGNEEIWVHNGNCWQLSCDINEGCTYCYDTGEFGTTYTGSNRSCNNLGYRRQPMTDQQRELINEVFKEVLGVVMLNSDDGSIKTPQYRDKVETCGSISECMGQIEAENDAINGMTYKEILNKYYNNFILSDMQENSYAGDVAYEDGGYNDSLVFYAQTDYKTSFCGLKNATISDFGCGVTSMAMVLSTFIDKKYTPIVVNEEAKELGLCSYSNGTYASFFGESAKIHGLGYQKIRKDGDKQIVLDALKSGNSLVIVHMGPGDFTSSGHYMVLSKVNEAGQVYVNDPYHYINSKFNNSGNGWYDFDSVIAMQIKSGGGYHIITKVKK